MIAKTKRIAYAYASSPNATRFGFGKTGCWTVELCRYKIDGTPLPDQALEGFAEYEQAKAYASTIERDWHHTTK